VKKVPKVLGVPKVLRVTKVGDFRLWTYALPLTPYAYLKY